MATMLGLPSMVSAVATNPNVKPNEWRLLPPHCMYVEGGPLRFKDPETTRRLWASDPAWTGMHHYCWAIVQEFRTFSAQVSRSHAEAVLRAAIQNLDYVIERSRPGFIYRADMFVRKARIQARLGQYLQAATTARQLIAESPELAEGYFALADVQIKAGRPDQARETLAKGDEAVKDAERFGTLKKQLDLR
ncbi:tetratricopeptide repeat protein [Quisquiliibacterium transsilvanicum]|uniref:Tetratricopeptide (TPR) repeat protein n=2 Tax=Quisquiliibacterium transsilvanicum TaxID=1549638 RepID=A0A7W8HDH5_9BURK|nr:tetratricopeptide (TPR) repeat protein [Quisquiliibacterium transsilvanicum]